MIRRQAVSETTHLFDFVGDQTYLLDCQNLDHGEHTEK